MIRCRLLIDEPLHGAWNMAVDEFFLTHAADEGTCCLRFYQWSEATLSIGYFQACAERARHPPSRGCPFVRRPSGGGAIVHDRELTYSLALPAHHPLARRADQLYGEVHSTLIAAMEQFDVRLERCDRRAIIAATAEPFLCFQRYAAGDLLCGPHKVAGSAQRRFRGAVSQHGSVLLAASPAAPELPGLRELTGLALGFEQLAEIWNEIVARQMLLKLERVPLSATERSAIERRRNERYGSPGWNERK